ncbi:MAG: ABC transporter permease, partial [Muribaculum sp.]|nr:ABC transporter permease [Muribaculum sp.]
MNTTNRHKISAIKAFVNAFISEMRLVVRDQGVLVFLVLLPLFYPLVYSIIYNPELVRDVTVVVVAHARTARSRPLARMLE